MTILEKILNLRNSFVKNRADSQDISLIESWYDEAKRLFLIKSLKDHDGIKYLLNIFTSEVDKINEVLKNKYSKELPDNERDRLIDKRDLAQKYINLFNTVEEDIDKLEDIVDKESL